MNRTLKITLIVAAVLTAIALVYYFCWEDGSLSLPGSDTGEGGGGGYTGITAPANSISTVNTPVANSGAALISSPVASASGGPQRTSNPAPKIPTRHL